MSLNPRLVAENMRQRLGLPDGRKMAAITLAIPEALKETGRRIAADPSTRALLVSDRTTAKVVVGADGKVNLQTAYTTYFIIKEFLQHGQMYLLPALTFATTDVDVSANTISFTTERFAAGDKVRFTTSGTLPGGLSAGVDYYVKTFASNLLTLAPTSTLLTTVDLTTQGTGTHTITTQETADFPLQHLANAGLAPYGRYLEGIYRYCVVEGDTLQIFPRAAAGSVAFAVPYYPTNLAALPESSEAELIFFEVLFNIITKNGIGNK